MRQSKSNLAFNRQREMLEGAEVITRIDLRHFKCFELLRLPLAPLTLLTGLNSSGKSSVLQAFALLNQTMREHEWSTRLVLNGKVVRLGDTPDVIHEGYSNSSFAIRLEDDEEVYEWEFVENGMTDL